MIAALRGQRGDANKLLGAESGRDGYVDISSDRWDQALEVLSGLRFSRIRLSDKQVAVNFVDCFFEASRFERVRSEGHFWAAGNTWRACDFIDVGLRDVISPGNVFEDCFFDTVSLMAYKPSRTVFRRCRFRNLRVEGLRAVRSARAESQYGPKDLKGDVAFVDCEFERPHFLKCFFADVEFRGCRVVDPDITGSSFDGVIWDEPWARTNAGGDPFLVFLEEVLEYARKRFGAESRSCQALGEYTKDYKAGVTKTHDYSAVLYKGGIPDEELDELEEALDEIESRYPF